MFEIVSESTPAKDVALVPGEVPELSGWLQSSSQLGAEVGWASICRREIGRQLYGWQLRGKLLREQETVRG